MYLTSVAASDSLLNEKVAGVRMGGCGVRWGKGWDWRMPPNSIGFPQYFNILRSVTLPLACVASPRLKSGKEVNILCASFHEPKSRRNMCLHFYIQIHSFLNFHC